MINRVKDYITEYGMISPGDEVVIGLSGGADSVCLLLNLVEYSKYVPMELKAVHINHMIREEAGEDAEFARKLCDKWKVPFYLFCEPIEEIARQEGISTEEAGRKIRYERFRQVLTSKSGKIAVAHNSNDVSETVLFNMFRGTGIEGLASLEPVNGNIIRPLLGVGRAQIEEYLHNQGQSYVTDRTNLTDMYARNKIRNTILPFAEKEIVSGATEHIASLSQKMSRVRRYIENEAQKCSEATVSVDSTRCADISTDAIEALDDVMQEEIILLTLHKLTNGRKDICESHVKSIMELLDKEGEKRVDLPYKLEAVKQYKHLYIREKRQEQVKPEAREIVPGAEITISDKETISARVFSYSSNMQIPDNPYTKWIDYDKIINCVILRNRSSGDYLTINAKLSEKSLKDYFINEKIPKEERDKILLLADGNHIIWVIGYRISEYYKISADTKRVMEISYNRQN